MTISAKDAATTAPIAGQVHLFNFSDGGASAGPNIVITHLADLWSAVRLGGETGLPAELFYGLLRRDLPRDLDRLLARPLDELRAALEAAIAHNILPGRLSNSLPDLMHRLGRLKTEHTPVSKLAEISQVAIPPEMETFLADKRIRTLADVRAAGPISRLEGLPVATDDPAVQVLKAQATLSALPLDFSMASQLVEAGYSTQYDIARTPQEQFTANVRDRIDPEAAAVLHDAATAQSRFLNNTLTGLRVSSLNESDAAVMTPVSRRLPRICDCPDCRNVTSPMAYLADLLDYAVRHVKYNGQPVGLTFLENHFHQPFGKFPASCDLMEKQVRQVRMVIEVLRKHLPATTARRTEQSILGAIYTRLLERIGTSFDELRRAQTLIDERQLDLLKRLQIFVEPGQRAADTLAELVRDPADPLQLTEEYLEGMFGWPDTRRDPLSPDPESFLAARRIMFLRWNIYRGEDWPEPSPPDARPLIDPDIIGPEDMKYAMLTEARQRPRRPTQPIHFWEDRLIQIDAWEKRIAFVRDESGLDALITDRVAGDVQTYGVGLGIPIDTFKEYRTRRQRREDLSSQLASLYLNVEAFDYLVSIWEVLSQNPPGAVLTDEWQAITAILIERLKRSQFSAWRAEEKAAGFTLSPEYFRLRTSPLAGGAEWSPKAWRASQEDRQRWETVLRARVKQEQAVVDGLRAAVNDAEEAYLGHIRHQLILDAVGLLDIAQKRDALAQRLQIDLQADVCQMTTRIAQAIETVQGVLFGARNGLLDVGAFTLHAPHFDEEWPWIGSYANWRAAMEIFVYPENALRPTLRRRQSPAFKAMVDDLRLRGRVTPEDAREAVQRYKDYFVDMCSLDMQACASGSPLAPGKDGAVDYQYLVARSTRTKRFYWSYLKPSHPDPNDSLSFWEPIDLAELTFAERVVGAVCYESSSSERYFYVFFHTRAQGQDEIFFIRRNLAQNSPWDAPRSLALPQDSKTLIAARVVPTQKRQPPQLSLWITRLDGFIGHLNLSGTGWDSAAGFQATPASGKWSHLTEVSARNAKRSGFDFVCDQQDRFYSTPSFAVGDFDKDGLDEVAVLADKVASGTGPDGNDIWVMKYDPNSRTWYHLSPSAAAGTQFIRDLNCSENTALTGKFIVAGDFDGDGRDELVVAIEQNVMLAGGLSTRTGFWVKKFDDAARAWGSLGKPQVSSANSLNDLSFSCEINTLTQAISAVVGDFDGDNRDELAILNDRPGGAGNELWVMDLGSDGKWRNLRNMKCGGRHENFGASFAVA